MCDGRRNLLNIYIIWFLKVKQIIVNAFDKNLREISAVEYADVAD